MSLLRKAHTTGIAVRVVRLVRRVVATKQRRTRLDRVYASYARAAVDHAYMLEMEEVNRAFEAVVGDGLGEGRGSADG